MTKTEEIPRWNFQRNCVRSLRPAPATRTTSGKQHITWDNTPALRHDAEGQVWFYGHLAVISNSAYIISITFLRISPVLPHLYSFRRSLIDFFRDVIAVITVKEFCDGFLFILFHADHGKWLENWSETMKSVPADSMLSLLKHELRYCIIYTIYVKRNWVKKEGARELWKNKEQRTLAED